MLGTTLWLTIATALLAATLCDVASGFARGDAHASADHAVESALRDALADYETALASAIATTSATDAAGGYAAAVASLPSPFTRTIAGAIAAAPDGASVTYTVVPTTLAAPACAPATTAVAEPDAVARLQCFGDVAESRASLHVAADVRDPSGAVLAHRDAYVTVRLFAQAPYVAPAGMLDGDAAGDDAGGALPPHEGDVAGIVPETAIHVRYACRDGAGSCANAAPPDPDASLRASAPWANGNAPPP